MRKLTMSFYLKVQIPTEKEWLIHLAIYKDELDYRCQLSVEAKQDRN